MTNETLKQALEKIVALDVPINIVDTMDETARSMVEIARAAIDADQPAEQAKGREAILLRTYLVNVLDLFHQGRAIPLDASSAGRVNATVQAAEDVLMETAIYTTPPAQPAREWVGLSTEDLAGWDQREIRSARYWEAKLREKNAGQPVVKEN